MVSDCSDYDPDFGIWRYITSYEVKDKFVWVVICYVESKDFQDHEDTFYSIIRIFRL